VFERDKSTVDSLPKERVRGRPARKPISGFSWPRSSVTLFCVNRESARLGQIVIVGGVAGSGKSRFVRDIFEQRWPGIARQLGIDASEDWLVCNSAWLGQTLQTGEPIRRAILEYGILRQETPDWHTDILLERIRGAAKTTFVVIWCEPGQLARRTRRRILGAVLRGPMRLFSRSRGGGADPEAWKLGLAGKPSLATRARAFLRDGISLHASLQVLYRRFPNLLLDLHERWIRYAQTFPASDVWVVDVSGSKPLLMRDEDWELLSDRRSEKGSSEDL